VSDGNTDEFFPKVKHGKATLPAVGEFVYIPTLRTMTMHVIGGRAKVVEVARKTPVTLSTLKVEGHPYTYNWSLLRHQQYELWQSWGGALARLPTDDEKGALETELAARVTALEEAKSVIIEGKQREWRPHTGNLPDYVVKVKERNSEARTQIGAAWAREDGSVTIKLNPCVVISWKDDVYITLYPRSK
jgi:hypothetical protein